MATARSFYQSLYNPETTDVNATANILNNLPKISLEANNKLLQPITSEEIQIFLSKLPNNKSPGTDGISYEFYKSFSPLLLPHLTLLFNNCLTLSTFPPSWKTSNITLIPKKTEDKTLIQNWRPIALLNSDYKIFMKILANRLNTHALSSIIGNHQTGSCANRNILDSFLETNLLLENPHLCPSPSWLLFVDQKKAFDRVNHSYLIKSLTAFGFSNNFVSLITNLYSGQSATLSDKGIVSESFSLGRGVRQGDPLSPLLYVISLEPFLRNLNSSIRGISIHSSTIKAKAYADDTTVAISSNDWPQVLTSINLYEKASNAEINFNKSKVLLLNGSYANCHTAIPFSKLLPNETILSLGFPVTNGKLNYKDLWSKLIQKMKNKISNLSFRNLSTRGRTLVVKSLILSQIWYYVPVTPPNYKIKREISSLISNFIRTSALFPAYSSLTGYLSKGGMSCPNLTNSITAILAKQFIHLLTSKASWAKAARTFINTHLLSKRKQDLYLFLSSMNSNTLGWPRNWKPWLVAWRNLDGNFQDSFQSPFILKEDLFLAGVPAPKFSIKIAKSFLSQASLSPSFFFDSEKCWHLLYKLPCDNRVIEVTWKFIHNAYPVGDRIKYFSSSDCPTCLLPRQNRNHFLLECTTSKWLWTFITLHIPSFPTRTNWVDCIQAVFANGSFKPNVLHATILILMIYELHCSHMKVIHESSTPTYTYIINSFKHRFNLVTQTLPNLHINKKVITRFSSLNKNFNSS
jgi:hypothetical protein